MAVLPAEYGIDPTGLGGAMGLTALAQDGSAPTPFEGVLEFNVAEDDPTAERIDISVRGLIALEDAPFPGYHGFYFGNIEEGSITVRLTVSGYWDRVWRCIAP